MTTTFSALGLQGPLTQTVGLQVTDAEGLSDSASTTVSLLEPSVNNTPPTAEAGGPYTVTAGASVLLDGSGSSDAEQDRATLSYAWDLDGDGAYDDASGITTTFSALGLQGALTQTVGLQVTDVEGLSDSDTTHISITASTPPPPIETLLALNVGLAGDGRGAVSSAPSGLECGITCTATFVESSVVTLTATPAAGSLFGGWDGACAAESGPICVLTLSAALTTTATFEDKPGPGFNPKPLQAPPANSEVTENRVKFEWDGAFNNTGEAPIARYTVIVTVTLPSGTPDQPDLSVPQNETIVYTFETTETSFTPDFTLPAGDYSWTVSAIDEAGNVTPAEETYSFTRPEVEPVELYLPFLTQVAGGWQIVGGGFKLTVNS